MIKIADFHVHLRDEKWSCKSTIEKGLREAAQENVLAIGDMPNLPNPVITEQRVQQRLLIARQVNSLVFYSTYVGLTADSKQVLEAIRIHNKYFPHVIGLKLFAGKSTVNLEVIEEDKQQQIYKALSGYKGVLTVHCEKEKYLKPELWDPKNPISYCRARPSEAELRSIEDQVKFAYDNCFHGILNIAHVSTPESVEFINSINRSGGGQMGRLRMTCEATPHHLFMYDEMMNDPNGIALKVNPPLRTRKEQEGLLECLKQGKINFIATDHAPHGPGEKTGEAKDQEGNPIYMSGIRGLHKWQSVIQTLRDNDSTDEQIENLTFNNAIKIFGLNPDFYKQRWTP